MTQNANPLSRLGPTVESLGLRRKAFPLAPGSSIDAVVIRELSGYDDDEIASRVAMSEGMSMYQAGKLMKREALRRSIVAYWPNGAADAVEVEQPFEALDKFNLRTQHQLGEFFEIMNGTEEADVKKSVAAARDWQPGDGAPSWGAAGGSGASTGNG